MGCSLFVRTADGALREMRPTCVLDFYVHETCQRGGWGRRLFDAFLEAERVRPAKLAYDRPSPKLIAFLDKHFGLSSYGALRAPPSFPLPLTCRSAPASRTGHCCHHPQR